MSPVVQQVEIGAITVRSGSVLVADPMYLSGALLKAVPLGQYRVVGQQIQYPEGGKCLAKMAVLARSSQVKERKILGEFCVDSGMALLVDESDCQFWKSEGSVRIGRTLTPGQNRRVAKLIEKQFGLHSRAINSRRSEFLEPIPVELETEISAYLRTFQEYHQFTNLFFQVKTDSTYDILADALEENNWDTIMLNEKTGVSLLAFRPGFGDGTYKVEGLYDAAGLFGIELEFIGPAQERILEAFPILRY